MWRRWGSWRRHFSAPCKGSSRWTPLSSPSRGTSASATSLSTSAQPSGWILTLIQSMHITPLFSESWAHCTWRCRTTSEGTRPRRSSSPPCMASSSMSSARTTPQVGQRKESRPFIFCILQAAFCHLLCIFYNHRISLPFRLKKLQNMKLKCVISVE